MYTVDDKVVCPLLQVLPRPHAQGFVPGRVLVQHARGLHIPVQASSRLPTASSAWCEALCSVPQEVGGGRKRPVPKAGTCLSRCRSTHTTRSPVPNRADEVEDARDACGDLPGSREHEEHREPSGCGPDRVGSGVGLKTHTCPWGAGKRSRYQWPLSQQHWRSTGPEKTSTLRCPPHLSLHCPAPSPR